jgi:hypothetical protein
VADETGPPAPPNNPSGGSGFQALAPIPGLTAPTALGSGPVDSTDLANFFNNLYKYLIGLAAVLAVIQIIRGGLEISTQDSVSKQGEGRKHIQDALLGLVLVLTPVLVFTIINPKILDLSLNLPPLATATPTTPPDDNEGGDGNTTDCTVSGSPDVLQIARCPNQEKTQAQAALCPHPGVRVEAITELNGQPAESFVICAPQREYVFLDTNPSWSTVFNAINYLQPMARSLQNQNNGSQVLQFASICTSAGRSTCLEPRAAPVARPFGDYTCDPLPTRAYPSGASGDCYNYALTCDNSGGILETFASYCDSDPAWQSWP